MDICYNTSPENVERLATLLAGWEAYLRGGEPGLPFYMDARQIRSTPAMTPRTNVGDIDIMDRVARVGDYAACLAQPERLTVHDVPLRVLTLPALITAKRAAGRPKDLLHLPALEGLRQQA